QYRIGLHLRMRDLHGHRAAVALVGGAKQRSHAAPRRNGIEAVMVQNVAGVGHGRSEDDCFMKAGRKDHATGNREQRTGNREQGTREQETSDRRSSNHGITQRRGARELGLGKRGLVPCSLFPVACSVVLSFPRSLVPLIPRYLFPVACCLFYRSLVPCL